MEIKAVVSEQEILNIVEAHLKSKGHKVVVGSGTMKLMTKIIGPEIHGVERPICEGIEVLIETTS